MAEEMIQLIRRSNVRMFMLRFVEQSEYHIGGSQKAVASHTPVLLMKL